ncbi:MAG: RNA polymerase factor sigma-54 [Tepidanaerobacteraceae bacterium]|jgi:RNA polymerase sigma-54 factor
MQMSYSLTLSQTQKLIMTPELRQAIKILQLSTLELNQYIERELLENPLLDLSEEQTKADENFERLCKEKKEKEREVDWEEYFQNCADFGYSRMPREKKEDDFNYENLVTFTPSLQDHLLMQLHLCTIPKTEFKIGEFLIGNIDNRGYLSLDVKDAAEFLRVTEAEVERVVKLIQTFEPCGIGARDLKECLILQIEQKGIQKPKIKELVQNHLKDLAEARYTKIAEALGITLPEVQCLKDIILKLDPKPGINFPSPDDTRYIVPDATIEKVGNDYVVIMNDTVSPRLSINPYYRSLLHSEDKESNTSKFLSNRLDSALWLIRSLEQRRITLQKVIKSIVDVQRGFFDFGLAHLKPLTLKQIAERVDVHESTVSRAINGKYVQTPRGIFELKFFFKSGIENANGSATSSESIKKMIKEMIEKEDQYNPLSDQKLADMLKLRGIIISRRTVAKYREEIGIPSSARRKRFR